MSSVQIVVVHGVGNPKPGDTARELTEGLVARERLGSPEENVSITQTTDLVTLSAPHDRYDVHEAATRSFSVGACDYDVTEVFWGDISPIKYSVPGLIKGVFRLLFGLRHMISVMLAPATDTPRASLNPRRLFNRATQFTIWFLYGPVLGLNLVALIGLVTIIALLGLQDVFGNLSSPLDTVLLFVCSLLALIYVSRLRVRFRDMGYPSDSYPKETLGAVFYFTLGAVLFYALITTLQLAQLSTDALTFCPDKLPPAACPAVYAGLNTLAESPYLLYNWFASANNILWFVVVCVHLLATVLLCSHIFGLFRNGDLPVHKLLNTPLTSASTLTLLSLILWPLALVSMFIVLIQLSSHVLTELAHDNLARLTHVEFAVVWAVLPIAGLILTMALIAITYLRLESKLKKNPAARLQADGDISRWRLIIPNRFIVVMQIAFLAGFAVMLSMVASGEVLGIPDNVTQEATFTRKASVTVFVFASLVALVFSWFKAPIGVGLDIALDVANYWTSKSESTANQKADDRSGSLSQRLGHFVDRLDALILRAVTLNTQYSASTDMQRSTTQTTPNNPDSVSYPLREQITERFVKTMDLAASRNPEAIYVVSHSQGTVVAVDGLEQWMRSVKVPDPDPPLHLITLGSPYEHLYRKYFPAKFSRVSPFSSHLNKIDLTSWINICRNNDYIGAFINDDAVLNLAVNNGKGHVGYWLDPAVTVDLHRWIIAADNRSATLTVSSTQRRAKPPGNA